MDLLGGRLRIGPEGAAYIILWAAAQIHCLNSCRSRFSGVYLVFEVFQDSWCSNKENPSAHWNAALSCPFMASAHGNSYLVLISFWTLTMPWIFYPISRFVVLPTKVAHLCFCLVRIEMPLLVCLAFLIIRVFGRGPPTTHHPHKRPSSSGGILGGWCANFRNLRERQHMHHPQFCTRDIDLDFGVRFGRQNKLAPASSFLQVGRM